MHCCMKKVYKVRHKATGLYYMPGQGSNLSKDGGKVYNTKNTIITSMRGGYTTTLTVPSKLKKEYEHIIRTLPTNDYGEIYAKEDDFELVEFEVQYKEIGVVKD